MKIKALLKIATIATVFALLVCTVPVFATEATPEDLRIAYCNLSFENETHLMYAVKSTDESLKLRIWTDGNTADEPDVTLDRLETREIAGENYQVFKYTGLSAHQMTDVVFAAAHDGKVQGTVHKYSIQQYAYSVIKLAEEEGASEEIKNLAPVLKAMLNYGAAMQEYQNHNTDDLANKGISDGYAISKADGWYTAEALDFYEGSDGVFYIRNANGLREFADSVNSGNKTYAGKTVKLLDDIDLGNIEWTPINAWNGVLNGTVIDGDGHTINNMTVSSGDSAGFISNNASSLTIENITFNNAYVMTTDGNQKYAGVIMGKNYSSVTLKNVKVKNSQVRCTWQCGGMIGFAEGNGPVFINCSIEDSFVGGYNSTAGLLFGLGEVDITATECYATNVKLYTDGMAWNSTQKDGENYLLVGHLYGKTLTDTNCNTENVTIVSEYPAE